MPITVRQLEAITRVSESLAKMCLQPHVTEEHVQEALRLFEVSTIDAARSGVTELVVLSPEQREELMLVETQIKQKLAIGATASKRHLVEDLARLGVNEWAVMRALMLMCQRGRCRSALREGGSPECTEGSKRGSGGGWGEAGAAADGAWRRPSRILRAPGARRGWFCRPLFYVILRCHRRMSPKTASCCSSPPTRALLMPTVGRLDSFPDLISISEIFCSEIRAD